MFNDPLSGEECERLVGQLGRTDVPWCCAHGRPSFVPVVKLGEGGEDERWRGRGGKEVKWDGFLETGRNDSVEGVGDPE